MAAIMAGHAESPGMSAKTSPLLLATMAPALKTAIDNGVPVVTMATGGCREIVEEGVTGLVVPQGDQVALNRALLSLVGDETQRRQFGQAALRVAEKRFSLEAWAQGAESVYAAVQRQPRDG